MISSSATTNDTPSSSSHSDFSIDHILNRAGNNSNSSSSSSSFSWLQCTRYCPPKLPRGQKSGPQKRQLGRHPRIPFTSHQLSVLEEKFQKSPYLSSEEVILLSQQLNLADVRVKIWFQNRRARERREKSSAAAAVSTDSDDSLNNEQKISVEDNESASSVVNHQQQQQQTRFFNFLPPPSLYRYNQRFEGCSPRFFASLGHNTENRTNGDSSR